MTRLLQLRAAIGLLALLVLIVVVAIPALAAAPTSTSGPGVPGAVAPAGSEKPGRGPKASKDPEVAVTLRGAIAATTGPDGTKSYTLTAAGKTLELDAGPSWFFGDNHPLARFVGKTVTIVGGQRGDEVDVESVDGVALREPGKPPWAGGWKAVGSAHPGWTQDKADRWAQHQADKGDKGAGKAGCWPPGQCKDHGSKASDEPAEDAEPDDD